MKARTQPTALTLHPLAAAIAVLLMQTGPSALAAQPGVAALPTAGQVVAGSAAIRQTAGSMTIDQASDKTVLNWNTFNIGSGASVTFNQPGAASVALNRVLLSDPSAIYGRLSANGQVFLLNPNGVVFGKGSRVDVGGLVASTLNLSDQDFLDGRYRFSRDGATGSVLNQGDINAHYVALLAPQVRNEGVITASLGTVAMAGGEAVTLGITGHELISVQVDKANIDTLVSNQNLIQASAGTVILNAQSANGLLGQVVNSGAIEANGITGDGGTIRFAASSAIHNTGSVSANAGDTGKGGRIAAVADLANPDSRTTVDGSWSAQGGRLSGDGGFIETSASHLSVGEGVIVNTLAVRGKSGQWLLDPYDFTIAAGGDVTGAALTAALATGDVTITTTAGSATCGGVACGAGNAAGNGDINVNGSVTIGAGHILTLTAYRNINLNSQITVNADPATRLYLWFGMKGNGEPGAVVVNSGGGTTGAGTNIKGGNFATEAAHTYPVLNNFTYTAPAPVDTNVFVRLIDGQSSTYGDTPTQQYGIYDATSGGSRVSITPTGGSIGWNTPITAQTDAGIYSLAYSGSFTLTGYSIKAGDAVNWTVNPRPVTITFSKTYDGTPQFSRLFSNGDLITGLVNNNMLGINGNVSSANAGTYNSLGNLTLTNSNYTLGSVTATISSKPVSATASKIYDGSNAFAASSFMFSGVIAGESVSLTGSATTSSANAGTYNNLSNAALSSGNYTFAGGTLSATIAPKSLDISVVKVFDTTPNFSKGFKITGTVNNEPAPAVTGGSATVNAPDVDNYTSFTANSLKSSNPNYTLIGGKVSASITKPRLDPGVVGLPAYLDVKNLNNVPDVTSSSQNYPLTVVSDSCASGDSNALGELVNKIPGKSASLQAAINDIKDLVVPKGDESNPGNIQTTLRQATLDVASKAIQLATIGNVTSDQINSVVTSVFNNNAKALSEAQLSISSDVNSQLLAQLNSADTNLSSYARAIRNILMSGSSGSVDISSLFNLMNDVNSTPIVALRSEINRTLLNDISSLTLDKLNVINSSNVDLDLLMQILQASTKACTENLLAKPIFSKDQIKVLIKSIVDKNNSVAIDVASMQKSFLTQFNQIQTANLSASNILSADLIKSTQSSVQPELPAEFAKALADMMALRQAALDKMLSANGVDQTSVQQLLQQYSKVQPVHSASLLASLNKIKAAHRQFLLNTSNLPIEKIDLVHIEPLNPDQISLLLDTDLVAYLTKLNSSGNDLNSQIAIVQDPIAQNLSKQLTAAHVAELSKMVQVSPIEECVAASSVMSSVEMGLVNNVLKFKKLFNKTDLTDIVDVCAGVAKFQVRSLLDLSTYISVDQVNQLSSISMDVFNKLFQTLLSMKNPSIADIETISNFSLSSLSEKVDNLSKLSKSNILNITNFNITPISDAILPSSLANMSDAVRSACTLSTKQGSSLLPTLQSASVRLLGNHLSIISSLSPRSISSCVNDLSYFPRTQVPWFEAAVFDSKLAGVNLPAMTLLNNSLEKSQDILKNFSAYNQIRSQISMCNINSIEIKPLATSIGSICINESGGGTYPLVPLHDYVPRQGLKR